MSLINVIHKIAIQPPTPSQDRADDTREHHPTARKETTQPPATTRGQEGRRHRNKDTINKMTPMPPAAPSGPQQPDNEQQNQKTIPTSDREKTTTGKSMPARSIAPPEAWITSPEQSYIYTSIKHQHNIPIATSQPQKSVGQWPKRKLSTAEA